MYLNTWKLRKKLKLFFTRKVFIQPLFNLNSITSRYIFYIITYLYSSVFLLNHNFVFLDHQTPIEDCVLECSKANMQCQLKTCCGPKKQVCVVCSGIL